MINLILLNKDQDPNKIQLIFEIDFTTWLIGIDWYLGPSGLNYISFHFLCTSLILAEV